jgi:hypothetical protein
MVGVIRVITQVYSYLRIALMELRVQSKLLSQYQAQQSIVTILYRPSSTFVRLSHSESP